LKIHYFTMGWMVSTTILQIAHACVSGTDPRNSWISCLPWQRSLYFKVFWNIITLLANLVFIGVFNFQWKSPRSRHAFCHSLHPLVNFLIYMIVFCKVDCVVVKLRFRKPTHTLISLQTCWHVLLKAWLKHDPLLRVEFF